MPHKIYVASSWRNDFQPEVVRRLREAGHEVYDFQHPKPGDEGFHWSEIDPNYKEWKSEGFLNALKTPIADRGFGNDWNAMLWADVCVMVLPCGRSAHIEAGYFVGANKRLIILLNGATEPELMYKMTPFVLQDTYEVIANLKTFKTPDAKCDCWLQKTNGLKERGYKFADDCSMFSIDRETNSFESVHGFPLKRIDGKRLGRKDPQMITFPHCPFCGTKLRQ